jgi:peptide deformylase|tara:strand:+ start:49 stop:543 length:495 start_codon:yes stop_codon:yes gene_type:complete
MSVKNFLKWPDKRLRAKAQAVAEITNDITSIWVDMIDTMNAMPGIGLAAPQIGIDLRLAVVDASEARNKPIKLANPEILQSSLEYSEIEEASPNLSGISVKIKRPKKVTVRFLNKDGFIDRKDFTGLWATSIQHQIDHLNGKMFFDHLSKVKRDILLRKVKKQR